MNQNKLSDSTEHKEAPQPLFKVDESTITDADGGAHGQQDPPEVVWYGDNTDEFEGSFVVKGQWETILSLIHI